MKINENMGEAIQNTQEQARPKNTFDLAAFAKDLIDIQEKRAAALDSYLSEPVLIRWLNAVARIVKNKEQFVQTGHISDKFFTELRNPTFTGLFTIDDTRSEAYTSSKGESCPTCGNQSPVPYSHYSGDRHRTEKRNVQSFSEWGVIICPKCQTIWADVFSLRSITTYLKIDGSSGVASSHFDCQLADDVCKKCGSLNLSESARQPKWGGSRKNYLHTTMSCDDCDSFEARFYELSGCSVLTFPNGVSAHLPSET